MKQAIVTGSTGFIGASFVQYLLSQGVEVLALGRKEAALVGKARWAKLEGAKYLKLDMDLIELLPDYLLGAGWSVGQDCIFFNLAWGGDNGLSDLNVAAQMRNVTHSVASLETSSKIGCSRFIQVGTMEEAFTRKYLDLDHHKHSYYNRHVIYSVAKMAAKQALEIKASQLGLDFIYVLHSHVMGPDDDKDSFLQVTLLKLIRGDELIFSTGEQIFDVISLEDCAIGYFSICQNGIPGKEYWVGSGDPRRLRDYVERMYALFASGKEMQFGKLPYNDIVLEKEVFSIADLTQDTGFQPTMTYEKTVNELHKYLINLAPITR
jgi:nucleoside-diphosphate-sugar epimerase